MTVQLDTAVFISEVQARAVREVKREWETCRNSVLMLVEPYNFCFDCFGQIRIDSN